MDLNVYLNPDFGSKSKSESRSEFESMSKSDSESRSESDSESRSKPDSESRSDSEPGLYYTKMGENKIHNCSSEPSLSTDLKLNR